MTTVQLRSRLIQLIQEESDMKLLALLDKLLDRASPESNYRALLIAGAERSEQDIEAGRTYSVNEAKARAKAALRRN